MKIFKKMLAVLTAALMLICMLPAGVITAEGDIPIDEAHFPDANFRNFVLTGSDYGTKVKIDTDNSSSLSPAEIAAVTGIDVSDRSIANLTGIEYFTALTYLDCYYNQLTQLDVSNNTALESLRCSTNQLTELDVSHNTALKSLSCIFNQLTELDVSHNHDLDFIKCSYNQLTALDVSRNAALRGLSCDSNQLTALDVSANTALEYLYCNNNQLTSLDVSNNPALVLLNYSYNSLIDPYQPLETLCTTAVPHLRLLGCDNYGLTELDVRPYTALEDLYCSYNDLTALDVSHNTALECLYCSGNQLTSLDVSQNTALKVLYCNDNQLTQLDVSKNTALTELYCRNNQLTSLDLSANTNLTEFDCAGNGYRVSTDSFDLSTLPGSFDVTKASNWHGGAVDGDILTFTADFAIYTYDCGNNHAAKFVLISPNAVDIPIDEAHFPDANFREYVLTGSWYDSDWNEHKIDADGNGALSPEEIAVVTNIGVSKNYNTPDTEKIADLKGIEYFTALKKLYCGDNQLTSLDVSKNTALDYLFCDHNQLTALDVSHNTALWWLSCCDNQLTELDVSNNTALKCLNCGWNQLTQLDVSSNTALIQLMYGNNPLENPYQPLETLAESVKPILWMLECTYLDIETLDVSPYTALEQLRCYGNQLTQLDVSKNTALTQLSCFDNQLSELDVSNNTALEWLDCNDNQLTDLNVNGAAALESLSCSENQLTELDVSNNTALRGLYCSENQLTTLDLSKNTALQRLYCDYNQLTQLDVSKNTALRSLYCSNNRLTSLDLSANTNLTTFECTGNQYKVSSNPFDLTALPGNFDVSKASGWAGGSVSGNILTFDEGTGQVTYTYDCGGGKSAGFTLLAPTEPEPETYTVTFDANGGTLIPDEDEPRQLTLAEGSTFIIPGRVYTKQNYYFAGWTDGTTDANGELIVFEVGTEYTMPNHDVTLTAVWNKIFRTVNMKLDSEISLGFKLDIPQWMIEADPNMKVIFSYLDKTGDPRPDVELTLSQAQRVTSGGKTYYRFYCPVVAKEMIDNVYGRLVSDSGTVVYADNIIHSVCDYVTRALNNQNNADKTNLLSLLKALLNYGAASQEHQDYKTTNLANAALPAPDNVIPQTEFSGYGNRQTTGTLPEGVNHVGNALMLISKTTLRFFFDGDFTGVTFKINDREVTPFEVEEVQHYCVESEGIDANVLNGRVTLTVTKGANTWTYTYGAFDYAQGRYAAGTNTKLIKVVQGLYDYHIKAVAYMNNPSN